MEKRMKIKAKKEDLKRTINYTLNQKLVKRLQRLPIYRTSIKMDHRSICYQKMVPIDSISKDYIFTDQSLNNILQISPSIFMHKWTCIQIFYILVLILKFIELPWKSWSSYTRWTSLTWTHHILHCPWSFIIPKLFNVFTYVLQIIQKS